MLVFTQLLWVLASVVVIVITSTTAGLGRVSGQLLYGVIAVVGTVGLLLRLTVPESSLWLQARDERRRGIHTVRADRVRVRDLFQPPFRRPVIVLVVFYTLLSVAGNVAASYVTFIAVNVGKIPIARFTTWSLVAVPATFIALGVMMKFVDTRARIPLFVAGGVAFAAGLLVPAIAGISLTSLVVAYAIAVVGSILCGEPIARVVGQRVVPHNVALDRAGLRLHRGPSDRRPGVRCRAGGDPLLPAAALHRPRSIGRARHRSRVARVPTRAGRERVRRREPDRLDPARSGLSAHPPCPPITEG